VARNCVARSTSSASSLPSGDTAFAGRAAREYRRERESARIADDGSASSPNRRRRPGTRISSVSPASSSSSGRARAGSPSTSSAVTRTRPSTGANSTWTPSSSATVTPHRGRPGSPGRGDDDVSGVLHGTDLRESHGLEDLLDGASLNRNFGLTYTDDGDEVKVTAARSGYVELYQPREMSAEEYLAYLQREIIHTSPERARAFRRRRASRALAGQGNAGFRRSVRSPTRYTGFSRRRAAPVTVNRSSCITHSGDVIRESPKSRDGAGSIRLQSVLGVMFTE